MLRRLYDWYWSLWALPEDLDVYTFKIYTPLEIKRLRFLTERMLSSPKGGEALRFSFMGNVQGGVKEYGFVAEYRNPNDERAIKLRARFEENHTISVNLQGLKHPYDKKELTRGAMISLSAAVLMLIISFSWVNDDPFIWVWRIMIISMVLLSILLPVYHRRVIRTQEIRREAVLFSQKLAEYFEGDLVRF